MGEGEDDEVCVCSVGGHLVDLGSFRVIEMESNPS